MGRRKLAASIITGQEVFTQLEAPQLDPALRNSKAWTVALLRLLGNPHHSPPLICITLWLSPRETQGYLGTHFPPGTNTYMTVYVYHCCWSQFLPSPISCSHLTVSCELFPQTPHTFEVFKKCSSTSYSHRHLDLPWGQCYSEAFSWQVFSPHISPTRGLRCVLLAFHFYFQLFFFPPLKLPLESHIILLKYIKTLVQCLSLFDLSPRF